MVVTDGAGIDVRIGYPLSHRHHIIDVDGTATNTYATQIEIYQLYAIADVENTSNVYQFPKKAYWYNGRVFVLEKMFKNYKTACESKWRISRLRLLHNTNESHEGHIETRELPSTKLSASELERNKRKLFLKALKAS